MRDKALVLEGKNAVLEAYRAGKPVDRLFLQKELHTASVQTILREAKKQGTVVSWVDKARLEALSETGKHQGILAYEAAFSYASIEDMLRLAAEREEAPFLFLLDEILDPHNLGAVIRTAQVVGAHGVIIPKRNAAGLTAAAVRASAGAVFSVPVAKVTNLSRTIAALKESSLWFACADLSGESMYETTLTGPLGLVIGSEGKGVSRLVKEACDFTVTIPMKGNLGSLNASVAAGVLAYEVFRQRQASLV